MSKMLWIKYRVAAFQCPSIRAVNIRAGQDGVPQRRHYPGANLNCQIH